MQYGKCCCNEGDILSFHSAGRKAEAEETIWRHRLTSFQSGLAFPETVECHLLEMFSMLPWCCCNVVCPRVMQLGDA